MEHTGSTAVEKPMTAGVMKKANCSKASGIETAPPLNGYVRFVAKPGADTLLTIDNKDPLFTVWQFGLGRAAVFTSDAKSRWAEKWIGWPGFDRFWPNVFRDLLPKAQSGEASTRYDEASGNLLVDYRLAPNTPAPSRIPQIYVFGPDGFRKPVPVRKTAEGVYSGQLPVGNLQGLFRIRPLEESRTFPETGIYRGRGRAQGIRARRAPAAQCRRVHRRPLRSVAIASLRHRRALDSGHRSSLADSPRARRPAHPRRIDHAQVAVNQAPAAACCWSLRRRLERR